MVRASLAFLSVLLLAVPEKAAMPPDSARPTSPTAPTAANGAGPAVSVPFRSVCVDIVESDQLLRPAGRVDVLLGGVPCGAF